jgi:trigger factor
VSDYTIEVAQISPVEQDVTVTVPEAVLKAKIEQMFEELAGNVQLKGFRKGKAPRNVLEKMYRKRVIADAEQEIIEGGYRAAIVEKELQPLALPRVNRSAYEGSGDYTFSFVIETRPPVESVKLDDIVVEKERVEIKDEAVANELEKRRDQAATMRVIDDRDTVQDKDWITLSYEGFLDGKSLEGAKVEKDLLHLGQHTFVPGFEEAIIGQKVGADFEFTVTFPKNFHAKELQEKPVTFKATVHDIQARDLPELDDEFAKDLGDYDSLDQLRISVREELEKAEQQRVDRDFRRDLWKAVVDANPLPLPPSVVAEQTKQEREDNLRQLASYGLDPKQMGMDDNILNARAVEQAERNLRGLFLEEKLAEDLGLVVGDDEIDAQMQKMADQMNMPLEQVKAYYNDETRVESMKFAMRHDRILDAIMDKVTVKEVDPKEKAIQHDHNHDHDHDHDHEHAESEAE